MTIQKSIAMTLGFLVTLATGLVTGLVGSASAGTRANPAWTATFTDPAADATEGGPDVTKVSIKGDERSGTVALSVTATGYTPAAPDGVERRIYLWLNTDKNDDTGSPSGSEYVLVYSDDPSDSLGWWWDIARWDGTAWQSAPETPTMRFVKGGELTWILNRSDLGGAAGFAVYASTVTLDSAGNPTFHDFAPDGGRWVFDLAGPGLTSTLFVTPKIGKPVMAPARVAAGKRLVVAFPVTVDGPKPPPGVASAMQAVTTIAGKSVPHSETLKNGVARVSLVVPKTAKGRQLKVRVTITAPSFRGPEGLTLDLATGYIGIAAVSYSGNSATEVVSLRVR